MTDIDSVQACETRLVNLWPAVGTLLVGDWVVRFANGYSGRANSASAIRPGADLSADDLALIASLYHKADLQPAIRLTPLADPMLEPRLVAAGWSLRTRSNGMVAEPSPSWLRAPHVDFAASPPDAWIGGISELQEPSKRSPAHLAAIVGRIRLPVAFVTLRLDGQDAAYGMVAIDRGWAEIGSIITRPEARGRGLGRVLVSSMLAWAVAQGAEKVFLQVEASNTVAQRLYRSLGFGDLYAYREYRLTQSEGVGRA